MSKPADKNIIAVLIKAMLWGALVVMAYVILKSCSMPKTGLDSFNQGSLSKLIVLESPPLLPPNEFVDGSGQTLSLADKKGKVVLLNLWATWCAPCIAEIPSLNALQSRYDKDEFEVVAVSLDRNVDEPREFLQTVGADKLAVYHDSSFGLAKAVNAAGVPVSILYNSNGKEVARLSGEADWNSAEAVSLIDNVLGK